MLISSLLPSTFETLLKFSNNCPGIFNFLNLIKYKFEISNSNFLTIFQTIWVCKRKENGECIMKSKSLFLINKNCEHK
jgi:hypothetical protein